jgi:antitoxin CcdA
MRTQYAHKMRIDGEAMMAETVKKAVNLRIDRALIDQAKAMGLNLSQVLESSLGEMLRRRQQELWMADNRDAIDAYNQRVGKRGVFSRGLRRF